MKLPSQPTSVFKSQWPAPTQRTLPLSSSSVTSKAATQPIEQTTRVTREQNHAAQVALENFTPERTVDGVRKGQLISIRV